MAPTSEASRVLALALDPAVRPGDDATSQRILDAALELAAASGLRHLTMDDVARRAAVGRMTVYRRFASKPVLVDALTVRESRRCLERIAGALRGHEPADERLAALFTATLAVIRGHPLLERLARFEPQALLAELTREDSTAFSLVREFLIGLVREGQEAGELIDGDPAIFAELAVRLGASFVLMPDTALPLHSEAETRAAIRALIAPVYRPCSSRISASVGQASAARRARPSSSGGTSEVSRMG